VRNLFEAARVEEVKERVAHLRPDSERLWGKMNCKRWRTAQRDWRWR
jgi:hypothetical protein